MFCHKCGTKIAEGAGFCHKCGTKAAVAEPAPQPAAPQQPATTSQQVDLNEYYKQKRASQQTPPPPQGTRQQSQHRAPPPPQEPPRQSYYQPSPPTTPDGRQKIVIGLCIPILVLRLLDGVGWALIVIGQIAASVGFWTILWNIVGTIVHFVLAVGLFGVVSSRSFNSVTAKNAVSSNIFFSVIGVAFYLWQIFADGAYTLVLFIALDIGIIVLGLIAYFLARQLFSETVTAKDMTVSLLQGETVIDSGACKRGFHETVSYFNGILLPSRYFTYSGQATLTNMRLVFLSSASNTYEWAVDAYGEDVPHHLFTDFTILLADIDSIEDNNKSSNQTKAFVIKTKDGVPNTFIFENTLKDSWVNLDRWSKAFKTAMASRNV
jgi:hypothetical protein